VASPKSPSAPPSEARGERPDADGQPPAERSEPAGWAEIAEWTGGLAADEVPPLASVRDLETVFPLLHALVGRSLRDFLVRAAALECVVEADRAALDPRELDEVLYWLEEPARASVVAALRRSGWLAFEPGVGTTLTDGGRWAYDVLAFLHRRLRESELLPSVAGIEYALEIGIDPVRHLVSMRSRLVSLREEIEAARASYSEVVLRRAADRLKAALELSSQIRAVLDRVPLDHAPARRVAREIHDLLSRLHGVSAELHREITEVGRQYLQLTAGMTVEQIVRALMAKSREELVGAGREALRPVLAAPPLLTTDVVASAAEEYLARERDGPLELHFEEPATAPRAGAEEFELPDEVRSWLADLGRVAAAGRPEPLSALVPWESVAASFLRASLLALVGDARPGEGVASQLGSLPLEVELEGNGWPEALERAPLERLTPGRVTPREPRPEESRRG